MSLFEKLQTVILVAVIGLGIFLGRNFPAAVYADRLVAPALMCMLFGLFLSIPLNDLKKSFRDTRFTVTSLVLNFLWIPLLGWWLGGMFLADSPALRIGFLILLVTPCTDWYLIFTAIAGGNVTLSAAVLPLNLVVQVALLPVYLFLFAGIPGYMDMSLLGKSIVVVLVIPFLAARLVRLLLRHDEKGMLGFLTSVFSRGQFWFLCIAIGAMFASQTRYLAGNMEVLYLLLAPVLLFFVVNFTVVRIVSALMKFSYRDSVSLNLTTLARNSPISLAIAVTAFPNEPLIALALVIGPLIELPMLAVLSQVLLYLRPLPRQRRV